MKTFRNFIILLGILTGTVFFTTEANATKKNKTKRTEKEVKAVTFKFDKMELVALEQQLIEEYLSENYQPENTECTVRIYNTDGGLFLECNECIVEGNLNDYEFLFEYDSVKHYLVTKNFN